MSSLPPSPPEPPVAGALSSPGAAAGRPDAAVDARPVLDVAALARLRELDPTGGNQLLDRVMTTFQNSAARLMAQLESARRTGDRSTIRLVAHTLKSSSGYIGAGQLASRCAEVESASRSEVPVDLAPVLDAMIGALVLTLEAIAHRLAPPPR